MLYVKNNIQEQELFIPRSANSERSLVYTLEFHGCTNNVDFTVENVLQSDVAVSYFVVRLSLAEAVKTGEYTYNLRNEKGDVVASGLARIGDYGRVAKEHIDNHVEIIEYAG